MYKEAKEQPGGWEGFRSFIVDKKVEESDVITSFYLKPEDGRAISSYQAGQYLAVKVKPEDQENTQLRHYSLSDAPGKDYYRISVKREDKGVVSNYLHQSIQTGDVLLISAPAGDFVLESNNKPAVLLSGGVGLTPMVSMLNTIVEVQPEREVTLIHGALNSRLHAMKEHVAQLADEHANVRSFVAYSQPTEQDHAEKSYDKEGYVDLEWQKSILPNNQADFYFCGPTPFMKMMYRVLSEWGCTRGKYSFRVFRTSRRIKRRASCNWLKPGLSLYLAEAFFI